MYTHIVLTIKTEFKPNDREDVLETLLDSDDIHVDTFLDEPTKQEIETSWLQAASWFGIDYDPDPSDNPPAPFHITPYTFALSPKVDEESELVVVVSGGNKGVVGFISHFSDFPNSTVVTIQNDKGQTWQVPSRYVRTIKSFKKRR